MIQKAAITAGIVIIIPIIWYLSSCERAKPPPEAGPTAGRVLASDGSQANIQSIHDTQAVDGDTITLPSGTFTWTGSVQLTKAVTILGQTTTDKSNCSANDKTIIIDNVNRANNKAGIECRGNGGQRISGLTFRQGLTSTHYAGNIQVPNTGGANSAKGIRIDHCHFDGTYCYPAIQWSTYNWGVIDHCLMNNVHTNEGFVHSAMENYGGLQYGDGLYMEPAGFGGPKFLFVEDNCMWGGCDITFGAKICWRYNKTFNAEVGDHGTARSGPSARGGRAKEVYNNEFHTSADHIHSPTGGTGGAGLFHDNTFYDNFPGDGRFHMNNYRAIYSYGGPFYGTGSGVEWDLNVTEANGTNVPGHAALTFDSGSVSSVSGSTLTDSGKNWPVNKWAGYVVTRTSDKQVSFITANTANTLTFTNWNSVGWSSGQSYQIKKAVRALDQIGLGKQTGTMDRNSPRWMGQADEPWYYWNNIFTDNRKIVGVADPGGDMTIKEGRDFFNNTSMPGYTPYTYPHPLVSGGGASPSPVPTPSATATSCPTATPTVVPIPPATPTATATIAPSPSPSPSPSPTPSGPVVTVTIDAPPDVHVIVVQPGASPTP